MGAPFGWVEQAFREDGRGPGRVTSHWIQGLRLARSELEARALAPAINGTFHLAAVGPEGAVDGGSIAHVADICLYEIARGPVGALGNLDAEMWSPSELAVFTRLAGQGDRRVGLVPAGLCRFLARGGRLGRLLPAALSAHDSATLLEAEPATLVAHGGARGETVSILSPS